MFSATGYIGINVVLTLVQSFDALTAVTGLISIAIALSNYQYKDMYCVEYVF